MKILFKVWLSVLFLICASTVFAQTEIEEINMYEIRSYDPQKGGLVDLVFEARIEKLTDILNKAGNFGKLSDVHYKIYWISPDQYKIEIFGLPKGFQEVRDDLVTLIKAKLEFIIPEKFSDKFKGYKLKSEPLGDGKLIKAIDDTYTMIVPEFSIIFDNNGRLKTIENQTIQGAVKSEFFQSPKSWSKNKLVLDRIMLTTKQGLVTNIITNSIEYTSHAGLGFPSKLSIKNIVETTIPAIGKEKEKTNKIETVSVIKFTNYEVNTGKAKRFISEGVRR